MPVTRDDEMLVKLGKAMKPKAAVNAGPYMVPQDAGPLEAIRRGQGNIQTGPAMESNRTPPGQAYQPANRDQQMADPNARGIPLAPSLRGDSPTYPRGMTNNDVMAVAGKPPVNAPMPYRKEITNNDVMAAAAAPTPGTAPQAPAYKPVGAAEAYGNVNLDREEVMKKLWLTKYGNDRAGSQAQYGSPASLIQNRWDLERSANTLRPAAVAPGPVMDPEQEAASRASIAAAMAKQNGIDYRAASAEQPGWAPPRTDADFARNAKAKEMGLGPGMMWDLERLKGLPGQGVTIPTPASERTYANPDALAPVRTERQYSDEVNRRNAPYEAANAPGSPAMKMLDSYNANRQSGLEMETLRRQAMQNQLKAAAMVNDPDLAKERIKAETEAIKAGGEAARAKGAVAGAQADMAVNDATEMKNRMATVDDQADKILETSLPALKTLLRSDEVDADMGPTVGALGYSMKALLDRARGWTPDKADRYREMIKGQLGISSPQQLDLNNFRDKVNRWLSILPTSGENRNEAVRNREQADMTLRQLKSFLFPGSVQ